MYKSLAVSLLLLSGLGTAEAKSPPTPVSPPARGPHFTAPEIDPTSVSGAIALLIGGLIVLRGRPADRQR
jgi:hypothetical protein